MTFEMLTVRRLGDEGDGALYPRPLPGVNAIELEPGDGSNVLSFVATAIELNGRPDGAAKSRQLVRAREIKATVHVTDCRVAVACSKYDKGGGWYGGVSALALNAASMTLAAVRRHGKVLVGQVRYPWLADVGFQEKRGWLTDESLRLIVHDRDDAGGRMLLLDLTLPKQTSAAKVAREISARAARFRLAHTTIDGASERDALIALLEPPQTTNEKGRYALHSFPSHYLPCTATAFGDARLEVTL